MISILSKIFIKDRDSSDPKVRSAYGTLCGICGIVLNILLFIGKFFAGTLSGSISITADAFNNLSDAGSSLITIFGFKFAGAAPDTNHPFGHGRIEYISGFCVSLLVILMGLELGKSSISKIIHPEDVDTSTVAIIILVCSILVKLYMFFYNRRIGKKINSSAMVATATDSLSDCVSTFVVLLAALFMKLTSINIDGWCGAAVSLFILYAGINAARDTISPLLGQPPTPELVSEIEETVMAHEEIIGIHDLIVHDYGPGRMMISLHGEVPGNGDINVLHDAIDRIERELNEKFSCISVIHMDPISFDDSRTSELRGETATLARTIDQRITIHDFRIIEGPTHTNVIFDAVVPQKFELTDDEVKERLTALITERHETFDCIINIDKSYI
jgi:cation diffusion facilitator family transporter